nr:hypothetical protein [Enterococcus sp. 669A]
MICAPLQVSAQNRIYQVDLSLTVPAEKAPELDDLIKEEIAKDRNKNDYTEDSWKEYEDALKEAQDAMTNAPYDEERINAALDRLQKAIQGLIPVQRTQTSSTTQPSGNRQTTTPRGTTTVRTGSNPTSSGTTAKNYPATGTMAGIGLSSLGLLIAGGAAAGCMKRKKK